MPEDIRNLADTLGRAAVRAPSAPALIFANQVLSWGELHARVDAVAAGLAALSLPADPTAPARIAIALPNNAEFVVAYFAVLRAGLVAVPINPGYTARELRHLLADSDAAVLIATPTVITAVQGIRSQLGALRHAYSVGVGGVDGARPFAALAHDGATADPTGDVDLTGHPDPVDHDDPDRLAVLLYTSGTGGAPKGAMLTHRALLANLGQLDQIEPPVLGATDVVLLALPLFHAFGLQSGLGAVAAHGACGVLTERFDPAESLALIARHRVSVVAAVPQMYAAWSLAPGLADAFASVRLAVSGAAPLDAAVARQVQAVTGQPIFQGYGLTETAPVVTSALASPTPKPGSIGRPVPGVQVRLVAADGEEIALIDSTGLRSVGASDDLDDELDSPGTDPGEIVVRGPNVFSGYWPDGRDGPDADGWWHTADVAYADADGDLYLVDRLEELILVSGFNVYPHEIELVLAGHPGVLEAAVVGVEHPGTGQAVKAYVVLDADATVTVADLTGHCERNLARFKCPSVIAFVPELPHTATGKVRKNELEASGGR